MQTIHLIYTLQTFHFQPFINRHIVNKLQMLWNSSDGNKLFEIKPVIGQSQSEVRNVRQEEAAYWLHKDHTLKTF